MRYNMSRISDHEARDTIERIEESLSKILNRTKSLNIEIIVGDIGNDLSDIKDFFQDRITEQESENN